ncbi:hypothetical protein SteCoe_27954 [Stentor coeruleus]|uniref:Calponin-homology (CH) domain-containing protein n=1 Tax=Stentor coeruleus TaxID=5963 RepID=A0A1R2B9K5_9CILI|nr:hypothetical protein SteCoe_27954 [Stentor coeruleus]
MQTIDPHKSFFIGKNNLLRWLSERFGIYVSSLDELSTGVIYCEIVNQMHPRSVQMSRVNSRAKLEYEFIANFKLLQQALEKNGIIKEIPVARLVKGFDHIEMLQWFKGYTETLTGMKENRYPRGVSRERSQEKSFNGMKGEYEIMQKKLQKIEAFIMTYPPCSVIDSLKKLLYGS